MNERLKNKQPGMGDIPFGSPKSKAKRPFTQPQNANGMGNQLPQLTRMEVINNFIRKTNQLIQITLKATDSINPI